MKSFHARKSYLIYWLEEPLKKSGTVFAGRSIKGTMYWISDLGIWYMYRFVEGSRHWNAFGTEELSTEKSNMIICEINSPPEH